MNVSRLSITDGESGSLRAEGVIDAHTAASLTASFAARGTDTDIRLDLTAVDFIDSSGLRVLVAAHTSLDAAGRSLVLSGVSDAVDRLLRVSGLHEHLQIVG